MRKRTAFVGAIATAGLLSTGAHAFADTSDNDGINIGNDNNVSAVPIQLCGNNVAVLGVVAPILSPQHNDCTNAPIVDHPHHQKPHHHKPGHEKPEKPGHDHEKPEKPGHDHGHDHEKPGHDHEKPDHPGGGGDEEQPAAPAPQQEVSPAENLPTAPAPTAVSGHHAVTG